MFSHREPKYDGQLLDLAYDLGVRLLPAFDTRTGIPVHRINLMYVPRYCVCWRMARKTVDVCVLKDGQWEGRDSGCMLKWDGAHFSWGAMQGTHIASGGV